MTISLQVQETGAETIEGHMEGGERERERERERKKDGDRGM